MINFFKKNWAIIGFLISFVMDSQYKILETLLNNNEFAINIVRGLGAFILAYFTKDKLGLKFSEMLDLGGSNTPPNRDDK